MGLIFLGVWLIHARIGSARLSDAALIGGAIGVAFLAHPVPAVLLATITTIAACTILVFGFARSLVGGGLLYRAWAHLSYSRSSLLIA
jgi:hypothetical protein